VRNRVALRWARNPWLAVLLLAALFGHALIPAGYMPGAGGLVLCPGYAPAAVNTGADAIAHDDMPGMDMSGILYLDNTRVLEIS
jgi:hypothetical protein